MLPRKRVIDVIEHRRPDRIPVHGWLTANMSDPIAEAFGSVSAFEDLYEFDYAHIFGGPSPYDWELLEKMREETGGPVTPELVLDSPMNDVDDEAAYDGIRSEIEHHKVNRDRFVYVQTPGIFECLNGVFGLENHLCLLAMHEAELQEIYGRQALWNRRFANNCIDLGIDMIHVSDDWGAQTGLMFSPEMWWQLIYPHHKTTCDAVLGRHTWLSLHSDGNVMAVLDGISKLGYQVFHPYQESAGMDIETYLSCYADDFVIMGGLDVQTVIGFGDLGRLRDEIERLIRLFPDGGLLLTTSHFVQDHCTIEELVYAYDLVYEMVRNPTA